MNRSIFWRLVWKEYRLQRALWIAMAVLTALLLWLVFEFSPNARERTLALFRIAVAFPSLYALGCGAMLFAGEQEAETYEFQRSLPVSARRVFASKIVLAISGVVSLFAFTWLLAACLNGWKLPSGQEQVTAWATFGFFGLEIFLWTTFFSLLLKRVLMTAILGVAAASVGAFVMAISITPQIVMETYVAALPRRAVLAALVALAGFWLATRWFKERRGRRLPSARLPAGVATTTEASLFSERFCAAERTAILGRLVWQHWRQSRWLTITILGTSVLPLLLIGIRLWLAHDFDESLRLRHIDVVVFLWLGILLSLISVPLLGLCAFHADQWRRGFRFLADRGVPPRYVWLSRQLIAFGPPALLLLVWLLAMFLIALLVLPNPVVIGSLYWVKPSELYAGLGEIGECILTVLGYAVLGITVGQLASMLLRSGFLAGVVSVLVTSLLAGWCWLMSLWGVNWLWSVVPIPLVLLLATRLRTRDWLLERNTLRAWLPPALVLLVPAVALLTAVPLYRVYSVPAIDPGFSLEEYDRPLTAEEQATYDLYMQASFHIRGYKEHNDLIAAKEPSVIRALEAACIRALEAACVRHSREAIALGLKASDRKYSPLVGNRLSIFQTSWVAELLIYSATQLEEQGKLDAAFDRYLAALRMSAQLRSWYPIEGQPNPSDFSRGNLIEIKTYARLPSWAARPGQTPKRILAAARRLEKLASDVPTADGIKAAHCCLRRFLLGDLGALDRTNISNPRPVPAFSVFWLRLPWERARALRLLNCITRSQLDALSVAEQAARRGEAIRQPPPPPREYTNPWFREMDSAYALRKQIYAPPVCYARPWAQDEMVHDYTARETSRRAVRLVFALEAWKLQHGALPTNPDELVGPCLEKLPVDPYSGRPFRYFRHGLAMPFSWSQPTLLGPLQFDTIRTLYCGGIDANAPFIWSTGAKVRCEPAARKGAPAEFRIRDDAGEFRGYRPPQFEFRWPASEYDVWSSGWPFPIP